MQFKAIIFDLDGTLIDSKDDIANSVNLTLQQLKLNTLPLNTIYNYIGQGVSNLIVKSLSKSVGKHNVNIHFDEAISTFSYIYKNNMVNKTACYKDVINTLGKLSHLKKAIVTNKSSPFTIPIIEALNLKQFFISVICGDTIDYRKPHPKPILTALQQLNSKAQDAIMVGDSFADIKAAESAMTKSCFARYGFGHLKHSKPDFYINSFSEIINIVSS